MKDLLRFVHMAGTERSTAKVFAELSRFIGETLVAHRVTVYVVEEGRFVPFVSEYCLAQPTNRSTPRGAVRRLLRTRNWRRGSAEVKR